MDDRDIVELYWIRSQDAISMTQGKYGKYCHYIAYQILNDEKDAEECVNDTYVSVWNSIPPKKPSKLKGFIGIITRNIALNRLDYNNAKKRGIETALAIDEMHDCIPDGNVDVENEVFLKEAINSFLQSLDKQSRVVFMRRYWYLCSVKEIASSMQISESNVKVILHRTRNKLKAHLEKEDVHI